MLCRGTGCGRKCVAKGERGASGSRGTWNRSATRVVADPNYAPMYATRSRRTKTDRRDARTLMDACQTGAYRLAHRLSDPRRHVRAELAVRASSAGITAHMPTGCTRM